MDELAQRDIDILDFERSWWKHAGVKEQAISERFEMSATRYYQILNELLETPAAMAHDRILVKRLQRLRSYRRKQRVARLLGAEYQSSRRERWNHSGGTQWGGIPLLGSGAITFRSSSTPCPGFSSRSWAFRPFGPGSARWETTNWTPPRAPWSASTRGRVLSRLQGPPRSSPKRHPRSSRPSPRKRSPSSPRA